MGFNRSTTLSRWFTSEICRQTEKWSRWTSYCYRGMHSRISQSCPGYGAVLKLWKSGGTLQPRWGVRLRIEALRGGSNWETAPASAKLVWCIFGPLNGPWWQLLDLLDSAVVHLFSRQVGYALHGAEKLNCASVPKSSDSDFVKKMPVWHCNDCIPAKFV